MVMKATLKLAAKTKNEALLFYFKLICHHFSLYKVSIYKAVLEMFCTVPTETLCCIDAKPSYPRSLTERAVGTKDRMLGYEEAIILGILF